MDERTIIVRQGSFGSFLRGLAVGAALAILFAPRSGRETRDMISEKGMEFKDKAFDMKDKAVDMAKDTRERAQTMVSDARNKFEDTIKHASESKMDEKSKNQLKRELEISEDIENPLYPL